MAGTEIDADIDFSTGGTLNINKNATLMTDKSIKLGESAEGTIADGKTLTNKGTIEITPTKADPLTSGESSYQYSYVSTDAQVKRVWSATDNLTEPGTDTFAETATLQDADVLSDYASGFQQIYAYKGVFHGPGVINQSHNGSSLDGTITIEKLNYSTTNGHFLDSDGTTYTENSDFFTGKDAKKVLSEGNSGGRFEPDIGNSDVMAKVQYTKDSNTYTLGETSQNSLVPDRLEVVNSNDKTKVEAYLAEFGVTATNLTVSVTGGDDIITTLTKATANEAVALPNELASGDGKIDITMPQGDDEEVEIVTNLHDINYSEETLNFNKPDTGNAKALKLSGDNTYLCGTINIGVTDGTVDLTIGGVNGIPGGKTTVSGTLATGDVIAKIPANATLTANGNVSGKINATDGATFNIG